MNLFICTLHPLGEKKRGVSDQIINVMRLIVVLTILCCFKVSASVYAQKISIDVSDMPIETVFDQIKKQSGYTFWYKDNVLEAAKRVTVKLKDFELKAALEACLKDQPLRYEISGKIIVIRPKVVLKKVLRGLKALEIKGKVLDEKGVGLAGVTVRLKGSDKRTITGDGGDFVIEVPDLGSVLVFSFVGYEGLEYVVRDGAVVSVALKLGTAQLQEVGIVNTGYQALPKERATGSFVQIDNTLLNRRVSTNILERLDGITSGLIFTGFTSKNIRTLPTINRELGISIRGESTILSSVDPLIVVDNFPYEGDIRNINPNDVESVTVLKDAAAASIWGARAGNGVIVITTKKGKLNSRMKIELTSNLTIANKPYLFYDQNYLNSSQFIEIEKRLFDAGYFNSDVTNTTAMTAISPVVDILSQLRSGTLSQSDADKQLNAFKSIDVRNDYSKYVYQNAINQQHNLALRGGGSNITYALSVGYDNNKDEVYRNGYNRLTVNSFNTFSPVKNLEINFGLNYSNNKTSNNNTSNLYGSANSISSKYGRIVPYAQLADAEGNPLAIVKTFKPLYLEQMLSKGFKDWNFRPLDEIELGDNTTKINDILFRVSAKYKLFPFLSADVNYQNEHQVIKRQNYQSQQSYFTRNMINKFGQYNTSTQGINFIFPVGDILTLNNYTWNTNNLRGQLNFNKKFNQHEINAIAGGEIRELKSEGFGNTSYGYDPQFGTATMNLNYLTSYPINPSGAATIQSPDGGTVTSINRYISYFANASYSYKDRYTFSLSGRKDGSNIFGANSNNRITPLWSAGLAWDLSKEPFYTFNLIPDLKLRATYGYNGNIGNSSALLTGSFLGSPSLTGSQFINIITAPNPELRWERVQNINLGIDFNSRNGIIKGTLEMYRKKGVDLLQPTPIAPQSGFLTFTSNAASTQSLGVDLTLQAKILDNNLKWNATLLYSNINDKVLHYDVKQTSTSIQTTGGRVALIGKPMYSIFSYKWAGLAPLNGDPRGYLNGQVSKDYTAISNNFNPDSLVFHGSARPTNFGSIRNDLSYLGFSLSINVTFKFGYYFRRPTISLNYSDALAYSRHQDYDKRWINTGDELNTSIPSMVYPANTARNDFYQFSEILVERGDHIRLQDIKLAYDFTDKLISRKYVQNLRIYSYLNNIGILWRKNSAGIDPDVYLPTAYPNPFAISLGLSATF